MNKHKRFLLDENDIPTQWYNIQADMPNKPLPPLNPATRQPLSPEDLSHIFSEECSRQELDAEHAWIDIPEEVQNLIFIALIKAEAQRAYIQRLMVRDGEVRIVFDPEAPMDGAKLFAAANNIAGAAMLPEEVPTIVIRRPKSDMKKLCSELTQIVYMMSDCIAK